MIYDAAVIIPTTLSRDMGPTLRSVYAQDFGGTVQIMIGVDFRNGTRDALDALRKECPKRMKITLIDLGYSTSKKRGGFYNVWSGGAIRTIMSYAANSRYLAYLDDDNWWAPDHLSDLLNAVDGVDWAWTFRWYVEPATREILCVDEWESVGPGRGIYKRKYDGFVDTNCMLIDKEKCHWVLPGWCLPMDKKGAAPERVVFEKLHPAHPSRCTGRSTAYYLVREVDVERIRRMMARRAEARSGRKRTAARA